ncbi:hypothetical protein ACIQXV_20755 [Neobacillus sp. NPDC097160]|uniref:hypothetical protein n=1 Tax=Neobacillus sp. NPDC097160 TaxID=3364298 RepID=UPI003828D3BA
MSREQYLKRREEELRRKIMELGTVRDSIGSYPEVIQKLYRDEFERLEQQVEQLRLDQKKYKKSQERSSLER